MHPAPYTVWKSPSGAAVVSMPRQIDHATCAWVHAALIRALQAGPAVVIADLTRTDFCGNAGTEMLARMQALAAKVGAQLRVAAPPPSARLIAQIARPGLRLDLYPDLAAALAGLQSRRTASRLTASGNRLSLIRGGAARRIPGKPGGRLSIVPPASQDRPPRPSP